jgi:hypothetical protein
MNPRILTIGRSWRGGSFRASLRSGCRSHTRQLILDTLGGTNIDIIPVSSLDQFLPTFDVESCHSTTVAAPSSLVYDAILNLDLAESPIVRALFALRCMPSSGLKMKGVTRIGFRTLHQHRGSEYILGLIGRFWTFGGGIVDFDSEDFREFSKPGYAKAIWSFHCKETSGITELSTVTRVLCLDSRSRRSFRSYWFFVRPFSGFIRRELLRLVKEKAERAAKVHQTIG